MNKKVYLSALEWTKTHNDVGGVKGNIIFYDSMSYEDYNKILNSGAFVLKSIEKQENVSKEQELALEGVLALYTASMLSNVKKNPLQAVNKIQQLQSEVMKLKLKINKVIDYTKDVIVDENYSKIIQEMLGEEDV